MLFHHYGADDGLPIGPVFGLAEDDRGLVWLSTSEGLVRWDGHTARCLYVAKQSGRDCWVCARRGTVRDPSPASANVVRDFWSLVECGAIELQSSKSPAELARV